MSSMKKVNVGTEVLRKKPIFKAKDIQQPKDIDFSNFYPDTPDEECDDCTEEYFNVRIGEIIEILNQAGKDDSGNYALNEFQFDQIHDYFLMILVYLKDMHDTDFCNASKGVSIEWPSEFPTLIMIINALLFSEDIHGFAIIEEFCENLKEIKTEDEEKYDYLMDIAKIFAEVGDYYLFSKGRGDIAFNYFRQTVDIMNYINDPARYGEDEYFEDIQKASAVFSFVYRAIDQRKSLPEDFKLQDDQELAEILADGALISYKNNQILADYLEKRKEIKSLNEYDSLWEGTCKFYDNLSKTRYSKKRKGLLRIDLGVYYILLHKCIIYAFFKKLNNVNRLQIAKLHSDADFFKGLGLWRYKSVDDFIKKEYSGDVSAFNLAFDILVNVHVIRTILEDCPLPKDLAYYTELSTLEYLLPISAQEPKYGLKEMNKAGMSAPTVSDLLDSSGSITNMVVRYSLMNVGHMNDPMEGKTLLFRLLEDKPESGKKAPISNRYVFLKSFTDRVDDIPMWVMYGGKAKGCCIVLDKDRIIEEGNYKLAKVCYLRENDGNWEIRDADNNGIASTDIIEKRLEDLQNIIKEFVKHDKDKRMEKAIGLLDPILYLFKSATYCHENEYRIIENTDHYDSRICFTKERDGGKIYIPSKQRVYIKQIILGPKFKAAEDTLPYLEYRCRFLAEELGLKTIEIKMSDADFI